MPSSSVSRSSVVSRIWFALGAILLIGVVAAGCGSSGGSGGPKIALLLPENETPRYESDDKPDFEAAVRFYTVAIGGELRWRIHDGVVRVAAVRLGEGPAVVWLATDASAGTAPGTSAEVTVTSARGLGPFGPERLLLDGERDGRLVLVMDAAPGTIAT